MLNTIRFKISKAVASALFLETIKRRARRASVTDVRFEFDDRRSTGGEVRITCSTAMAIFFVEELRQLAAKAAGQRNAALTFDCERAVAATFKAIDEGDRGPVVAIHPAVTAAESGA